MLRFPQGLPAAEVLRAEGHAVAEYDLCAVPTDARVVFAPQSHAAKGCDGAGHCSCTVVS